MHIVIPEDYQDCVRHLECFTKLSDHTVTIINEPITSIQEQIQQFKNAQVIVTIRERTKISSELLAALPQLKLISQIGKINTHLDLLACKKYGVRISEGVGTGASTAELTILLTLAALRNLVPEVNRLKNGLWQGYLGKQLRGKTFGILGLGKVGLQVAKLAQAFGANILVWGREGSITKAAQLGYQSASSKNHFYASCDIVSLHTRLYPQTQGIVTLEDLQSMKTDSFFINTSRAELIESGALEQALRSGRPGFAAVDVFETEPVLQANHPLIHLPNCLCTPHLGYVEKDNFEAYFGSAFDHILLFAQGRTDMLLPVDTTISQ